MKNAFRATLAALLAALLLLGSASAVMVDEDGYLEEILLEDGEEIQFEDSQADASLQASIDKVNELQHILLLGIDARPGQTTGRSDTMIILTVDTNNQKIKLMSLMRDIIVAIPGRENNRLNAAYYFGGPDLLLQTIENNFGIHIEHYVGVNFSLLADLIDQIGGLTLTVESEYYMGPHQRRHQGGQQGTRPARGRRSAHPRGRTADDGQAGAGLRPLPLRHLRRRLWPHRPAARGHHQDLPQADGDVHGGTLRAGDGQPRQRGDQPHLAGHHASGSGHALAQGR